MRTDGKLNYLELPGGDLTASKRFYEQAFGWRFIDYGPEYAGFDEGLDGGFDAQDDAVRAPLPVLWADDLETMQARIEAAGGVIVRPIFDFPGGRRLHFRDPTGNEMAAWSDR